MTETMLETTHDILVRALGGEKRLRALLAEVPPGSRGRVGRRAWLTQVSPERAHELVAEGRASASMHPWTAIVGLLDEETGLRARRSSAPAALTLPGAYLTAQERAVQVAARPVVTEGSEWRSRKTGKRYAVEEVTGESVWVRGVGEYAVQAFHRLFEPG